MFEAHGMSFPCTELLLFNYAKVNTVFHSMAPLKFTKRSNIKVEIFSYPRHIDEYFCFHTGIQSL